MVITQRLILNGGTPTCISCHGTMENCRIQHPDDCLELRPGNGGPLPSVAQVHGWLTRTSGRCRMTRAPQESSATFGGQERKSNSQPVELHHADVPSDRLRCAGRVLPVHEVGLPALIRLLGGEPQVGRPWSFFGSGVTNPARAR